MTESTQGRFEQHDAPQQRSFSEAQQEWRDSTNEPNAKNRGDDRITRDELEAILAERDRQHAEQLQAARAGFPAANIPMNAGGPGVDNHQVSWNLAEQEAAARGETLDHWKNV